MPHNPSQTTEAAVRASLFRTMWPFACVLLFALLLTTQLWNTPGMVFSRRLEGDGILPVWFYDFISRYLSTSTFPSSILNLDYPCPNPLDIIPNYWDALLVAPLSLALQWPQQWGATMAAILIANALSLGYLARAAGCRHLGIIFAGCMGVLSIPLWNELQSGRSNGAWPSIAFATVALLLHLAKWSAHSPLKGKAFLKAALPRLLPLGILGALALTVYPLYVPLVAPAGLILLFPHLLKGRLRSLLVLATALSLGLAIAAPTLKTMTNWRATHYQRGPTCSDVQTPCPHLNGHAYYGSLARVSVDVEQPTLEHASAGLGAWILLTLLLFVKGRRLGLMAITGWIAILAYLSLGPCPSGLIPNNSLTLDFVDLGYWKTQLWCRAWEIRRMERFLIVALGFAGMVAGLGLESIWSHRSRALKALSLLLAVACLTQCAWLLQGELDQVRKNWSQYTASTTAQFLRTQNASVVAELPFDSSMQFLSDLEDNRHLRLNPFLPDMRTQTSQPFLEWLHKVGDGIVDHPAPPQESIAGSGVHFVFYDPNRCGYAFIPEQEICEQQLPDLLKSVLGEPTERLNQNVLLWKLSPEQGSQQAVMAQCSAPIHFDPLRVPKKP